MNITFCILKMNERYERSEILNEVDLLIPEINSKVNRVYEDYLVL